VPPITQETPPTMFAALSEVHAATLFSNPH